MIVFNILLACLVVVLFIHAAIEAVDRYRYRTHQNFLELEQMRVRENLEALRTSPAKAATHCPKCGKFAKLVQSHPTWEHVLCSSCDEVLKVNTTAEIMGLPVVSSQTVAIDVVKLDTADLLIVPEEEPIHG